MTEQNEVSSAPAQAVEANGENTTGAASAGNHNSAEASSAPASAPSNAAEGDAEHGEAEGEGEGDEPGEPGEEGAAASGEGTAEGSGDPTKKKRRRRRKKKPGARPEGAEGEAQAGAAPNAGGAPGGGAHGGQGGGHGKDRPVKEGQGGVFARFFDGPGSGKRHAFAPGEVVAGRVSKINEGSFAVDLFGKAIAYVDIFEPHEVPVITEPVVEAPAASEAASAAEPTAAEPATESVAGADASLAAATGLLTPASPEATAAQALGEGASPEASAAPAQAEAVSAPVEALAAAHEDAAAAEGHEAVEAHEDEHGDHGEDSGAEEPEPAPPPAPELGSIFRGRIGSVAESGHVVLVNRIIDVQAAKKRIAAARDARRRVRGLVYGFNRGGFDVLVEGIRVFCPASGMALNLLDSPDEMIGQRLDFTVPPAKAGTHGLVVSRRGILERLQRKNAKKLFRTLTPGQKLKGRVTQVREFGVFVDLGGIEGLVHQSELSFSRGVRPEDVCKPGDEVDVQVLRVGEGQTRKERERVSLSMKALLGDPWAEHAALLEPGNVITGKVVRTTDFGAFIELAPQVEGLLHISELGRELKHANQALTEGSEIRVVIERADRKARRISLSKLSTTEEKSLEGGGAGAGTGRAPKPGQQLLVVVDKIDVNGLIVQIPGVFGRRGRGFVPNVEMGTERGTDHRRGFPPGTEIQVKAIGVDRDGGFRFSRKALLVEEEKRAVQDYRREASRHGLGTFGDLLRAKLEGSKQS